MREPPAHRRSRHPGVPTEPGELEARGRMAHKSVTQTGRAASRVRGLWHALHHCPDGPAHIYADLFDDELDHISTALDDTSPAADPAWPFRPLLREDVYRQTGLQHFDCVNNRVARAGIEPATFRFSGGRSYQLSYLAGGHDRATPNWRP
jgi:hypothetical protein